MNIPRPARVFAIARRDLVTELAGRRGMVLGLVTALLLVPSATVQVQRPTLGWHQTTTLVNGDVPEEVAALPCVEQVEGPAHYGFARDEAGTILLEAPGVRSEIRAALDGDDPAVRVTHLHPKKPNPGRTMLFALISASVLTGAVSESFGGERSRRTFQGLLSAAVTRFEVVLGKWLAWAGYGGLCALAAGLVAVLTGRVEAGWWLLPLPTVAAATVALGIYLVRHAPDVIGSATISLRYLPIVLAGTGMISWYYGDSPLLAAALPIGGALLAAGDTWAGAAPALVATASTLTFTAVALALAAHSLDMPPPPGGGLGRRLLDASAVALVALLAWWLPVASPELYALAGNPKITAYLTHASGVLAGGLALLLMSAVQAARSPQPLEEIGLKRPSSTAWWLALLTGAAIALCMPVSQLVAWPETAAWAAVRLRIAGGLQPVWLGLPGLLLVISAQELLYRGWLQRMVGPALATAVFVAVHGGPDPLPALVAGGALAALTYAAHGSVLPALLARAVWVLAAFFVPSLSPWISLALAAVLVGGLALHSHRENT